MGTPPFHNDPRTSLVLPKHSMDVPVIAQDYYIPRQDYAAPPPDKGASAFLDFWHLVRRSKLSLTIFTLAGIAAAILITMQQTPIYQSKTTLELQAINDNFFGKNGSGPTMDLPDYSPEGVVQTQIKILQSNTLAKRVVQKVSSSENQSAEPPNRMGAWKRVLGLPEEKPENAKEQAIDYATRHTVVKAADNTRIVEVTVDSPDRNIARDFANAMASEYIEQNLESRWKTTEHTGDWLTKQLEGLKVKLERSEDELQNYAATNGLMFTGERDSVSEDKLRQLQQELSKAESDRAIKQSRYELSQSAPPESLPEVLDDGGLKDYQSRLKELRRQYAELSSTLTPAHYKVQKVQAQIAELEKGYDQEKVNVIRRIKTEYDASKRREGLIQSQFGGQSGVVRGQSAKMIKYSIIKREVDTNRQLYDSMLQRVKEAGISAAMRASNVRIVDQAEAPLLPYKPSPVRNAIVGMMGGLFLGLGFVFLRDRSDRSIQSPGDAQLYLNVPEFGVIPSSLIDTGKQLYGTPRGGLEAVKGANGPSGRESLELALLQRSPSLIAESFRSTLTSILFSNQNSNRENQRLFVLTSPSPSEGKTTVLTNLGLAMVETQRRVLLIDADMRRPRLHDVFGIPNDYGLGDVLASADVKKSALRAIVPTEAPGMCVMPSGPPAVSISTLLHSAQLPRLLEFLTQEFDAVLIDTPPMMHLPDARIMARLAGGVILVIRSGKTTRDTAQLARQRFLEDGTPVLGTILNDWNPREKATYGYQNYESGYRQYAGQASGKNGKDS